MAPLDSLANLNHRGPSVVTIGTFDGVHPGHRQLIELVARRARNRSATAIGLTFHPRPGELLRPDIPSLYLCSIGQRVRLLREAGLDQVIVLPFDLELSEMTAEDFSAALVQRLGMCEIVGGPDLALGHRRAGTPDVLREIGRHLGFDVVIAPVYEVDGVAVRSRLIRQALMDANLPEVEKLLGRRFSVEGVVVRGVGRGSTIGVPTANAETAENLALPANGVYAVYFDVDGKRWAGAGNLGVRPTFDGASRSLEVHLLDYSGDLYGAQCVVEFVERLRPEQRFATVSDLVNQINADVAQTRHRLAQDSSTSIR